MPGLSSESSEDFAGVPPVRLVTTATTRAPCDTGADYPPQGIPPELRKVGTAVGADRRFGTKRPRLGRPPQRIASRYARYVQRRSGTTGHFFERRHHDYLGERQRPWLETATVLARLDGNLAKARLACSRFVAAGIGGPSRSPLHEARSQDGRVLGDEAFRNRVVESAEPVLPKPRPTQWLDEVIETTCRGIGVTAEQIVAGDRSRGATRARCEIATRAVQRGVATRSEVARRLGCRTSAVSQTIDRSLRTAGTPGASPAAATSGTSET